MVLNQPDASPESDLTEELLSILHTFNCRMPRTPQIQKGNRGR